MNTTPKLTIPRRGEGKRPKFRTQEETDRGKVLERDKFGQAYFDSLGQCILRRERRAAIYGNKKGR